MRLPQKLSPRAFITSVVIIAIVSVTWTVLQFLYGNTADRYGRDSYGIKGHGYRALFEILDELDFESDRTIAPPVKRNSTDKTLVVLEPDEQILLTEQKFVGELREWIEDGGTVVYAPRVVRYSNGGELAISAPSGFAGLLPALGISNLQFELLEPDGESKAVIPKQLDSTTEKISSEIELIFSDRTKDQVAVPAQLDGDLAELAQDVQELKVYTNEIIGIKVFTGKVDGSVSIQLDSETDEPSEHHVVVSVPLGKGKVYVLSMPCIAENRMIAQSDNAALLVSLAGKKGRVEIDEFFHGRYVQGNILYLLTRPMYTTVFLLLLIGFILWTLRTALFLGPKLDQPPVSRRSIKEYITAMGQFLGSGRDSPHFLLLELRSGLIFSVADELGMYEGVSNPALLFDRIEKTNPKVANHYRKLIGDIDRLLAAPQTINRKTITPIVKEFRLVAERKL